MPEKQRDIQFEQAQNTLNNYRETSLVPRLRATTRTETSSLASQGILSPNNPSRGGYVQKSRTHQS